LLSGDVLSGYVGDVFRIGATGYTSLPLYAPTDKDGSGLLLPGQEGYAVLGQLYGEFAHAERGQARSLGGYLRLSGTPDGSLVGGNMALARVVMARRIGEMPVGLGGAVRIGFSLETGAVGATAGMKLPRSGWQQAASGFLSVDTRFGPFFLALGATRGGETSAYLLLGPTW